MTDAEVALLKQSEALKENADGQNSEDEDDPDCELPVKQQRLAANRLLAFVIVGPHHLNFQIF